MNTVTYGTAAAPFLAVRCLKQIALDIESRHPELSEIICRDFYMDDLITSVDTLEQASQVKEQLSSILKLYQFNLRKWLSNDSIVLNHCKPDIKFYIQEEQATKALGIIWYSEQDMLQYCVNPRKDYKNITKRSILSAIPQIFDPLGLIGPTIVKAKILLQRLWQLKVAWDESLPMDIHTSWLDISQHFEELNAIQIPRLLADLAISRSTKLHCFSDASEQAFGCCIYLRSVEPNHVRVELICARSRVAPLKQISVPGLELCGALLASQLTFQVVSALRQSFDSITLWTDSTIVLSWIRTEPNRWKTFVANRVSEIQDLTSFYQWKHVPGEVNPVDIISIGLNPDQLTKSLLW